LDELEKWFLDVFFEKERRKGRKKEEGKEKEVGRSGDKGRVTRKLTVPSQERFSESSLC
jgi:hypothetical protein